jgi:hypothetical protein
MVSHCANPDCGARFRYLNGGKLFHIDVRHLRAKGGPGASARKQPGTVEHFWLCAECTKAVTIKVVNGKVVTVPVRLAGRSAAA